MDALVAHDPARVPWAPTVRYTENNVSMMIGDGIWGAATARDRKSAAGGRSCTGNVGWYGTVAEHGQLSYYVMRLKVEHQRVSEVEVILDRKGDAGPWGDPAHFTHDPAFSSELPAAQRSSRQAMIALVDGYFSTIQKNDGALHTRFDPECAREENGQITTNGSFGSDAQGCEAQFRLGTFRFVDRVRDRRFTRGGRGARGGDGPGLIRSRRQVRGLPDHRRQGRQEPHQVTQHHLRHGGVQDPSRAGCIGSRRSSPACRTG